MHWLNFRGMWRYFVRIIQKTKAMNQRIELYHGDITKLSVDAIVNAANNTLLGGGGVDGAIHRAAGKGLLEECRQLNGCSTGDAKLTLGYNLPARYVIHTVGPVWHTGNQKETQLLRSCYEKSLILAETHGIESVAFPNISTGIYGYPKEDAAQIAIETVVGFLQTHDFPRKVIFCVFDMENFEIYNEMLQNAPPTPNNP
jgi:O-acetyl-ADP-ribose deacetylase